MKLELSEAELLLEYKKEGLAWRGWPWVFWTVGAFFTLLGFVPSLISAETPPPDEVHRAFGIIMLIGIYFIWSGGRERRDQMLRKLLLKLADETKPTI
jgi:hypothetical protein